MAFSPGDHVVAEAESTGRAARHGVIEEVVRDDPPRALSHPLGRRAREHLHPCRRRFETGPYHKPLDVGAPRTQQTRSVRGRCTAPEGSPQGSPRRRRPGPQAQRSRRAVELARGARRTRSTACWLGPFRCYRPVRRIAGAPRCRRAARPPTSRRRRATAPRPGVRHGEGLAC
jgi:hypothetical protein